MRHARLVLFMLVACFVGSVRAATINVNTIISAENSIPRDLIQIVDGESPPTVVQMIDGGEAIQVNVAEHSIFNFFGGTIEFGLHARNESQVHFHQGTIPFLTVRDNATANIFGGTIESEVRLLTGFGTSATLNIFDGLIRGNVVPDAMGGILNIHGGRMGSLFGLGGGSTVVNISGGSLELFRVDGTTTVHWSGGELRSKLGTFLNDSILNIYGHDLEMEELPNGKKLLSGTLLDGTDLANHFIATEDNAQIILHNVPEPSSLALLTVASITAFSLRRKRICVH